MYFDASQPLSQAELEVVSAHCSVPCVRSDWEEIEGVPYLLLQTEGPLNPADLALLSRLSFAYALFQAEEREGRTLLLPLRKQTFSFLGDELGTILKYGGKTNELFTRLLLNLAVYTGDYAGEPDFRLLDPVAGKGTTLFEALIAGYDAYGVEIGPDAVQESVAYLKKYLETGRYKHTLDRLRIGVAGQKHAAVQNRFTIAATKDDAKRGNQRVCCMIAGDAQHVPHYFQKNFFHAIVGDLPYGVKHGNVSNRQQSALTRNPAELLKACLPGWIACLLPGGALVLSWNRFVLAREALEALLTDFGLEVLTAPPFNQLAHRVDNAIWRDIIVARKPK